MDTSHQAQVVVLGLLIICTLGLLIICTTARMQEGKCTFINEIYPDLLDSFQISNWGGPIKRDANVLPLPARPPN